VTRPRRGSRTASPRGARALLAVLLVCTAQPGADVTATAAPAASATGQSVAETTSRTAGGPDVTPSSHHARGGAPSSHRAPDVTPTPDRASGSAHAGHAHGTQGHGGAGGPHDATARHSFEDVEHWSRIFDDPARDAWQKPAELVAALALAAGATVADVGAGTGYFSRHLSEAAGPDGAVLAADTEPALVGHLRRRAEQERLANVVPILASPDNPRLPAGACDVVLIVNTWHHIDDRVAYAHRLAAALKPTGRVVIVDFHKRELPVGPPLDHKLAREQVIDEMTQSGYRLTDEPDVLPYQYVLSFTRTEPPA